MQVISFKDWLDFNEGFEDEPYSFHAVFMAGGPASGKTIVAKSMFQGLGFQFSNSDSFYERLALKHGFNASAEGSNFADHPDHPIATLARGKSTKLAKTVTKAWQGMRYPLVIDLTSRDAAGVVNMDNALKEKGYDTFMVFVNTHLQKAVQRNTIRGQEGGMTSLVPRAAGAQETEDFWHEVQANKELFKQRFGDNYAEVDNSDDINTGNADSMTGNNREFRIRQAEWHRVAIKLLGPPKKVRNPIGAAMLAQGTNYEAMGKKQPQPQPQLQIAKPQPQLGVA